MQPVRLWVVAYDISAPKRLRRAARLLEVATARVQKSVYETTCDWRQMDDLRLRLKSVTDDEYDSVLWHPLCGRCARRVQWQGRDAAPLGMDYWVV